MKPERVQPPSESETLDTSQTDGTERDAPTVEPPAAEPEEKRPAPTSDMKPERVQKQ